MSSNLAKIPKKKLRKAGKVSHNDLGVLEQFYTKGSGAYVIIDNLQKATNASRKKIELFADKECPHEIQVRRNFPRLKIIAYDVYENG